MTVLGTVTLAAPGTIAIACEDTMPRAGRRATTRVRSARASGATRRALFIASAAQAISDRNCPQDTPKLFTINNTKFCAAVPLSNQELKNRQDVDATMRAQMFGNAFRGR